jgi:lyso-ornithine lipid O-acyltransferase
MGTARALCILLTLTVVTPPLMLLQWIFVHLDLNAARTLPIAYHRFVCGLLGVRVHRKGSLSQRRPLLIASNHVSWLDISVLSTIGPVSFIAKSEVAGWPVFGWLAKLQRSVFVDRNRRAHTGKVNSAIGRRLATGDVMVLFAEGTSSDGNRVLPFRSALLGAAHELVKEDAPDGENAPAIYVQPVALVYTHLNGLPMGHQHRPVVAWHGDIELAPHLWRLLRSGAIDVTVAFGEPIPLSRAAERKSVAGKAERTVRGMAAALLSGRDVSTARAAPLSVGAKTG